MSGFQVVDMGYQQDGTYQVVISGKVQSGGDRYDIDGNQFLTIKEKLIPLLTDDVNYIQISNNFEGLSGSGEMIPENVRKMDLILKLLPEDFDYNSDVIIKKARVYVLAFTLLRELPKFPKGNVTKLTFSKGTRGRKNPMNCIIGYLNFTDGSKEQWDSELYGSWHHPDLGWRDSGTPEDAEIRLKQKFNQNGIYQQYEKEYRSEQEKYLHQIQLYFPTINELERLDKEGHWKKFLDRIYGKI